MARSLRGPSARRPGGLARLPRAARATGDPRAAFRAIEHLPSGYFSAVERSRLRAWFAAASGDPTREKNALDALVAEDPGDTAALDRLAELALARGETGRAETLHRRKAEMMSLEAKYAALIDREDRAGKADELAALAAALGRKDEANGWALVRDGRGGLEPLHEDAKDARQRFDSLAALFADLRPAGPAPTGQGTAVRP